MLTKALIQTPFNRLKPISQYENLGFSVKRGALYFFLFAEVQKGRLP
jgi:hypothetical protein